MTGERGTIEGTTLSLSHSDRLFIGGRWVVPSSRQRIAVVDSTNEEVFLTVPDADERDLDAAIGAAREAYDEGPWPTMSPEERAEYLRAMAAAFRTRDQELAEAWPREAGALFRVAQHAASIIAGTFDFYADLASTFEFEKQVPTSTGGAFGLLTREPVGVVGAIIPWNVPAALIGTKVAPALLAGCPVVLKLSPEAPFEGYIAAEIADSVGLPPGVLNVLTADRSVSEGLVRDPRVDKITFTGSTAAGRRIGAICGERIARCTLELGGKSAAVVCDDYDIETAARTLAASECAVSGQICVSLTRIIVSDHRHDDMVDALAAAFSEVKVGDPFEEESQMGPLVSARQRERVEGYIAQGVADGATLAAGGGRPSHLSRGYYIEPTVFGNVQNSSTIAQEEIFGPVLSVIRAHSDDHAVELANDTIYGLNSSVFTTDVDRARTMARRLRSGTVGHNALRTDPAIATGGFKQSGLGREGGQEGLLAFLETKAVVLDEVPAGP